MLSYCRVIGDMNEMYKLVHGLYDDSSCIALEFPHNVNTRGNGFKLVRNQFHCKAHKYSFVNRVVTTWCVHVFILLRYRNRGLSFSLSNSLRWDSNQWKSSKFHQEYESTKIEIHWIHMQFVLELDFCSCAFITSTCQSICSQQTHCSDFPTYGRISCRKM